MRHYTEDPLKEDLYISNKVKEYLVLLMQAEHGSYSNFRKHCGLNRKDVNWSTQTTTIPPSFLEALVDNGFLYRVINNCYFLRRTDIVWCNTQLLLKHYPDLYTCLSTHGIQKSTWDRYQKQGVVSHGIQQLLNRYSLGLVYKARRSLFISQEQRVEAERRLLLQYNNYVNFCTLARFPLYQLRTFFNNANSNYNTILLLTRLGLLKDTHPAATPIKPIDLRTYGSAYDDPHAGIYPEDPDLCYTPPEDPEEDPTEEDA